MNRFVQFCLALLCICVYHLMSFVNGNGINFHQEANCSIFQSVKPYDVSRRFTGTWNYVRLFTEEPMRASPNCISTTNIVNVSTVVMNITIPHPEPEYGDELISTLVYGALDSKMVGKGQWIFFSDNPLAPSKWIILADEKPHMLYLICGDYPDGTSAVGEIGILSRETELDDEVAAGFQDILHQYDLNVTLSVIQHNQCPEFSLN